MKSDEIGNIFNYLLTFLYQKHKITHIINVFNKVYIKVKKKEEELIMGKMMKTAVMLGIGKMGFEEREIPVPKDNEVLVKLEYVGICGSDLHYYETGAIGDYVVEPPFVLGHEPGGTVVEVGKNVKHLKAGDRVALEPGKTCGHCEFCKTGNYNLCPDVVFFATPPVDGVFQEYVAHEADLCFKLPDNVSTLEGALIEPLAVGFHAAMQGGATVAVFSLEMSKESLMDRMLCAWGRVDMGRVRRAEFLDDTDWKKLADAADDLSRAKIFIDDTAGLTPLALRARCRRLKAEHGLDLVMVDYLQLMHSSRNESRELEISDISRNLKALAKEMKVPVLALSQLNRKVEERTDKRPVLSDLRESGAIEQDADLIMFIHREDQYNKKGDKPKTGIAEIILGKHRNGPTGTVELAYRSQYTAFDDLEASYTPPSEG